ncbi:MAG: PstS family phosphate ABC transporter substrate-binding protein [Fidelibacterota bacterium]
MRSTETFFLVALLLTFLGCGGGEAVDEGGLSGTVSIDGSSTVFPITEAVAEEFQRQHRNVRVTVGISGTGGGFKKFTVGETDINDASRPIKSSEVEQAKANGMEYIELPVAFDGISVVVNPANEFVDSLTAEELKKIWQPGSTVQSWSDVRASWPDSPLTLYGPGTDSGTFDYFTEAINGRSGACRPDFTASEDDNVLVQGIAGDENALGFFGFAYYAENRSRLRVVPVDGGEGPVTPSDSSINNGTYQPLSRPIFIYVSQAASQRPELREFVKFYLEEAPVLVKEVGYVPLPQEVYRLAWERFEKGVTGSLFSDRSTVGIDLVELLAQ